ncbi:septum formation family protein [Yonghaparkia sp. Soil809]|uniref:septum formation family protein n=1 Tax=Yonghaparkia sp. Soil809 TaxID=1736417 RepID=UPI0006FA287A|nr:septum formation family protein [Yonghaparkia sp. Soil809]KRF32633.1 hypothetical protein ASG83_00790 [Yonghaparkia sp. Soil809]
MSASTPFRRALAALALVSATAALSGCAFLSQFTGGGEAERDTEGQVIEGNDSTDVFTIQVGDCLNDAEATEQVETVPTTPCDEPHDSEVYASVIMSEDDYPGEDAILERADSECLTGFESFVGASYDESPYDFSYYFPTEGSWAQGDREILCVIYDPAGPVTGSLEGSSS